MEQDFFTYLPSEIIVNILSRLPIRSIILCKRVCKSWLDLLETREFVRSHISKSAPGIAVFEHTREIKLKPYKITEFVDEHRWSEVFSFNLPFHVPVHSEANGLLFFWKRDFLVICNPITRDYITVPFPLHRSSILGASYGFGVSRISGQYKVLGLFLKKEIDVDTRDYRSEFQVYSVGTGSWRRIASAGLPDYGFKFFPGTFLNGNLHWLAHGGDLKERISCFDLETEVFSTSSPPRRFHDHLFRNLSVLGGCLCLCDNLERVFPSKYHIVIWLMKEYGDEKSWRKEFVIRKTFHANLLGQLYPIKVFEDGDILMELGMQGLVYYSNKTKNVRKVGSHYTGCTKAMSYTPCFVSLKTFAMENVVSY